MLLAMAQNEHVKPCLRATDTHGNFIMKIRRILRVGERHAGKYIRGVTGLKRNVEKERRWRYEIADIRWEGARFREPRRAKFHNVAALAPKFTTFTIFPETNVAVTRIYSRPWLPLTYFVGQRTAFIYETNRIAMID